MPKYSNTLPDGEPVFVGLDLHNQHWYATARTSDAELYSATIPGDWTSLRRLLDRYAGHLVTVVYEAGYFGFWLHDLLAGYGADCVVTPASLIPREAGNRVKTDRRDSRKLALLLAKGMLKRVWVPSARERAERQVARQHYERLKARAGAKRAIIAVARKLLLCTRRMLLNHEFYVSGFARS